MKFTKPVGATADLREIEYISALHQTSKELRRDGSINSSDISKFLMSRYGISVTTDQVTNTISKDFGGGGLSEDDGDTLDLTELVALMIIPELLKAEMSLHRDYLETESSRNSGTPHTKSYVGTRYDSTVHELKSGSDDVWNDNINGGNRDGVRGLRGELRWPDSDLISQILGT
jgi:hypothetical protein